jgi:peroxiredoxin
MPQAVSSTANAGASRRKAHRLPATIAGDKMAKEALMIRLVAFALAALTWSMAARAALDIGDRAPDFTAPAAQAGNVYRYSLGDALKKGPVVVYFFPAAYSQGCSVEAHEFAEAIPQFQALGATVVGVSGDDIDTLSKFSVQACQSKFPVASDETQSVMRSYDAVLKTRPEFANRVSYVIAPDGRVVYHYMSLNPMKHVEKMLGALKSMQK